MLIQQEDTICAISTAIGEGGIGILRLSGEKAVSIAENISCLKNGKKLSLVASHHAVLGMVKDSSGNIADEAIFIVMRSPHSYTCEDVVEIQAHGGAVVMQKILRIALAGGARFAEPGEFTKRAFINGRIDLTQAEAVIDVIQAKTERSLGLAGKQIRGFLSQKVNLLREEILRIIAPMEAVIDFPDEDIDESFLHRMQENVTKIKNSLAEICEQSKTGKILRDGLQVAIVGKPNAGKSSVLNVLLRENRAIVTEIPGTTRDVIEESLNIAGIPIVLADTAGIRATEDVVEKIGVERSFARIDAADVLLLVLDRARSIDDEDLEIIRYAGTLQKAIIVLLNKSDVDNLWEKEVLNSIPDIGNVLSVIEFSAKESIGIKELEDVIKNYVYKNGTMAEDSMLANNARQINLFAESLLAVEDASQAINDGMPLECIAVDLRVAWGKLGSVIGENVGEDIIKEIFSRFCIGK